LLKIFNFEKIRKGCRIKMKFDATKLQADGGKDYVPSGIVGWHALILSFGGFSVLPLCCTSALIPVGCS